MTTRTETPAELAGETREAVRDLILVLADSKRLLGYRYAEWMLGAPELETGIACSSMAQDEWGHARLLYALLKDFDEDVEHLEHGREPGEYRNMEVLDAPAAEWSDVVALMVVADLALSIQFEALRDSSYEPLLQRVEKLLDEERFHAAHGAAWNRRLAGGPEEARGALRAATEAALAPALAWFGPDSGRALAMAGSGVVSGVGSELRRALVDRLAPLLEPLDVDPDSVDVEGRLADFDEVRRRSGSGGPDEETIQKIRGDRNREFFVDA